MGAKGGIHGCELEYKQLANPKEIIAPSWLFGGVFSNITL